MTVKSLSPAAVPSGASVQNVAGGEVIDAAQVPPLGRAEAGTLATAGLARFVALLEELTPAEWARPTLCTEWDVRAMVAHQAGAYASGASLGEFRRQWMTKPLPGRDRIDAVNAFQIGDRAGRTPAELIAELRSVGPRAIANRGRMSPLVRALPVPIPPLGWRKVGYLLDEIYLRDTWIHTVDVVQATGRGVRWTAAHDGRIVALVVRDLSARLAPALGGASVLFELTGPAGGRYRVGSASQSAATITMDTIDFNLVASTRISAQEGEARAVITGDVALARRALAKTLVVY